LNTLYSEKSFQSIVSDLSIKYETEKKELKIAALEEKEQLYIWLVAAAAVILLLAFGLLLFLYRVNAQKRKLLEQQCEIAEHQVKQLEQEKQLVATQAVLDGETAERSRLARDLHDGLGGMLSVVKLNLNDMKHFAIVDGPDVERFGTALDMLDQSIGELRRVAHHIMPESLMRYGLKVAIEDFCRAVPIAHFQYLGENSRLDNRLEVLIYRCAYELINNAVKHAQASAVNVQLMVDNGVIALTVHDNGVGFDPQKVNSGMGLENIRTRIAMYNGKMTIHSAPGEGTEVSIEID
jgi:signal transduction histidine kinase